MAYITLNTKKLKKNFHYLDTLFEANNIKWSVVSKMLCGNKEYIRELYKLGVRQMCDSRVSNIKAIKAVSPEIETIYIKPPAKKAVASIVRYADISFNTEIETIELLSREAGRQNKIHKIFISIEMGELREGVMREELIEFYEQVFRLPNISVVGLATNLTCMYGVLPSHDKLIQLCLYEQLIEAKFNRELKYVSGGSSVTIPLIFQHLLPVGINHFRVGETLYLGTDVYHNTTFEQMESDVFCLFAQIIELTEKQHNPVGQLGHNLLGESLKFDEYKDGETSYRAIIDLGLLDADENHIQLKNKALKIVGASSDMLVIDLGENEDNYQVGDLLEFEMDYMGVLRIMNSQYIEKKINDDGVLA